MHEAQRLHLEAGQLCNLWIEGIGRYRQRWRRWHLEVKNAPPPASYATPRNFTCWQARRKHQMSLGCPECVPMFEEEPALYIRPPKRTDDF